MIATRDNFPLLAELLADQQRLQTPVALFSADHDAGLMGLARVQPRLIPLTAPKPGEQYAFEVDLDSCTGCKSCVAACHSLNGLDDEETWRDVGLLVSNNRRQPFTQTVTSACHHCADPACLNGCPVLAYEKDPVTGIVRHLDDQCIGCQYCVLKCPYDAPKYNARLGIVRKCDMCHGRLAEGEAPACVQACPTHAIKIVTVRTDDTGNRMRDTGNRIPETGLTGTADQAVDRALQPSDSLGRIAATPAGPIDHALPDPAYTRPTTRFVTKRRVPDELFAGDARVLRVQAPHWPLVVMLTLLPVAVGLGVAAALAPDPAGGDVTYYVTWSSWLSAMRPAALAGNVTHYVTLGSWLAGAAGLGASIFHLGKPWRAWRIFLGWRKSWLSREALVFGAWFGAASVTILRPGFVGASGLLGVGGLVCSAMIYVDTRRRFWRAAETFPRFLGTAALFALAPIAPGVAAFALLAKLAWEARAFFDRSLPARLQRGPLASAVVCRDLLGLAGVILLLVAPGVSAVLVLLAGEFAERHLFFRAVDAPKMPGMPT